MKHDGISFMIAIGKPILRPRIELTQTHLRLSWLFFGFWIFSFDMESFFRIVLNLLRKENKTSEGGDE